MDAVRALITKRIDELGLDLSEVSTRMGKNHAYMQQFLKRGVPVKLKEDARQKLADILGVDEQLLGAPLRRRFPSVILMSEARGRDLSSEDVASSLGGGEHIDSMQIAADKRHIDPDAPPTIGSETGRRGIPRDATAQLDVTAGMGGGGLTIISSGVPGQSGMTFAAEHVRDYWRLPPHMLTGMGLRPHDIVIIPVQGDSMLPTLNEGDCVFVDTRHRLPSPDGIYALTDEFGGIVVKRLEVLGRRDDDVLVHVISDNDRHPAKERLLSDIQIIGRVVRRFGVIS